MKTFEILTEGICLICLKENGNDDETIKCTTSITPITQYLQTDLEKLSGFPSEENRNSRIDVDIRVSLCEECISLANNFCQLFEAFENIRMQMDNCVQSFHDLMKEGENDVNRVQKFKRGIKSRNENEDDTNVNSTIAEDFRKEAMEKCLLKLDTSNFSPVSSETPLIISSYSIPQCTLTTADSASEAENEPPTNQTELVTVTETEYHPTDVVILDDDEEETPHVESILPDLNDCEAFITYDNDNGLQQDQVIISSQNPDLVIVQDVLVGHYIEDDSNSRSPQPEQSQLSSNDNSATVVNAVNQNNFPCPYCGKMFRSFGSQNMHAFVQHSAHVLAKHLPKGVSTHWIDHGLRGILERGVTGNAFFCPLSQRNAVARCRDKFRTSDALKSHIFKSHLRRLIEELRGLLKDL